MQLQSLPPPKEFPPHPPQQSRRMMMSQQEEPLPSLQEHPPPHCVADKSLIVLPPNIFYTVILCRAAWAVYTKSRKFFNF